ncbi:MAG: L,D-transpeptidase [Chloroflexota bacterium]|nr:L,D-transpeptidase [Chloroflexota bacterium]
MGDGRFRLLALLLAFALLAPLGAIGGAPGSVAAQDSADDREPASYWDANLGVEIPGGLGQTELQVWIPATQHTVRGYMLDYWRAQGTTSVYGNPISEPYGARSGYYSQAFESGIFQFRPEFLWTESPSMTLEPVGREILQERTGKVRRDGKRAGGGGDPRDDAWRTYGNDSGVAQRAENSGGIFDSGTGHSITGEFLAEYLALEGTWYLGAPLSQPLTERGVTVQYFEGAVLTRTPLGKMRLRPVVAENPKMFGVDTAGVAQNGLPEFSETMFWKVDNPNPLGDPNAPGKKWIEISLSEQTLWAYQGDTLISSTLISTGQDPNGTEVGRFHVRYKVPLQDMAGTTNAEGEVVALGQEAAENAGQGELADQSAYTVEDVPDVMYFNLQAEALHGAYWHNNFGNKMSHGCVNLPTYYSPWLYSWAPLGTQVWVHE